jgi:hypothetical protein
MLRAGARPTVGGVRACAAALTVGLIFWFLFHQGKRDGKETALTVGLIFCTLFDQAKSVEKKIGKDLCTLSIRGKSEKCYPQSAVYKYSEYGGFVSIHLYIFANYIYSVVL